MPHPNAKPQVESRTQPLREEHVRPLVLIGGGGHALVVAMIARMRGWRVAGYFDDAPNAVLSQGPAPLPCLGTIDDVRRVCEPNSMTGSGILASEYPFAFLALGDLSQRARALDRMKQQGCTLPFATLSWIDQSMLDMAQATVGEGTLLALHSVVQPRARIGNHSIINTGAIVEHECELGMNCHLAPGAVLGGRVHIGDHTLVGMGSRVLPGVKVGSRCIVGAGAVVTHDVPDGSTVVGIPAHAPHSGILSALAHTATHALHH